MPDSEHNTSLAGDPFLLNTLLLLTASSLALALTACLWHHFYSAHPAAPHPLPLSTHPPSLAPLSPASEEKDRKSTRSKERRRRGKDPFRDLLKAGKKSKGLLKAIKAADSDLSPPSADMPPHPSVHGNDDSATSRSQSPEPPAHALDLGRLTRPLGFESDDGCSARDTAPSTDTSSTSAAPSSGDISDHNLSDAYPLADADSTRPPSCPPPATAVDTPATVPCPSTATAEAVPSFPQDPTPQPCDVQTASASGSCVQLVRARTRLRASKIDSIVRSSSATIGSVAGSSPCPLLSISASTRSSDGAGPSTPTNAQLSPPRSPSPSAISRPTEEVLTAQAQLASMRDALEAAQRREEQLRVEAERAHQEREQLCWRWNKDAGVWRCREAELQAHIHHLMQQLQAYAAVASFQAQQQASSSGFSSPTSPHAHPSPRLQHHAAFPLPPAIRAQNSASPPAHVQALLASTPMLIAHPPGFAAPPSAPGGAGAMSPLMWSGMAPCVPNWDARQTPRTPDSSSRGRRRRRGAKHVENASDESSWGDWDGMEDGSENEEGEVDEEEDIFSNNALADAILKRPESIRDLSASARRRSGVGRGKRPGMAALKDPAVDPPVVDVAAVAQ